MAFRSVEHRFNGARNLLVFLTIGEYSMDSAMWLQVGELQRVLQCRSRAPSGLTGNFFDQTELIGSVAVVHGQTVQNDDHLAGSQIKQRL